MIKLLDRNVMVYRLSDLGDNKQGYATLTTTLEATIQPLGDSKAGMAGGAYGKLYKIFMDADVDIQEGDQIRDKDGNIYKVIAGGLENRTDGFMADYCGITCQKIN
jgi:hypothetical protein